VHDLNCMVSVAGNKEKFRFLGLLLIEYNLSNKKLIELNELDKLLCRNVFGFIELI
jgi:hypothetical protein